METVNFARFSCPEPALNHAITALENAVALTSRIVIKGRGDQVELHCNDNNQTPVVVTVPTYRESAIGTVVLEYGELTSMVARFADDNPRFARPDRIITIDDKDGVLTMSVRYEQPWPPLHNRWPAGSVLLPRDDLAKALRVTHNTTAGSDIVALEGQTR